MNAKTPTSHAATMVNTEANDVLARYRQANDFFDGIISKRLVLNDTVRPYWIKGADGENSHCFWYVRDTHKGKQYRLVNAKTGTNESAFDHQALVDALTDTAPLNAEQTLDPENLTLGELSINVNPLQLRFHALDKQWLWEPEGNGLQSIESVEAPHNEELLSPDGTKVAFQRDHNLWVRDCATGEEKALTNDGTANNSYAESWMSCYLPNTPLEAVWSPDSKHLFTVQLKTTETQVIPLVQYAPADGNLRPTTSQQWP